MRCHIFSWLGGPCGSTPQIRTSFKRMCLTCDFTLSGEISKARAMCFLERPWSLTRQLDAAERPHSGRTSHPENRLSECIGIFLLPERVWHRPFGSFAAP